MTTRPILVLAVLALLVSVPLAAAGPDAPGKATPLDAMKKLVGAWETGDADKDGKADHAVVYRLTAAGSAVEETLFPGTDHEMVTMYTMDGDDLVLTHYCAMGNQPHMKAKPAGADGRLDFEYVSGGNMKSRDEMHMDSLTMTFPDADHLGHEWRMWAGGKVVKNVILAFARKK